MEINTFSFILYSTLFTLFIITFKNLFPYGSHRRRLPPGPRPWPIIGNLPQLGSKPHQTLSTMVKTYGPLIHLKFGFVDVIVASSASIAEQFLKKHDVNFSNRPPNSGAKHIAYNYQDLVFAPYGPRWRLLRKICSVHLFSAKALDDFQHVRQEEVGILVQAIASGDHAPVNLGQLLGVCTTNALARVMLGRRVFGDGNGGANPQADEFKAMVVEIMVLAGAFNLGDFIPILDWLDLQGIAGKMKKLHVRFDKFLNDVVEEHKSNGSHEAKKHVDLLSVLISLQDNNIDGDGESKLSDTEIKALLLNLFTAGTDTSSSTVEWAIAELIRNPKLLAQAQDELDRVVGPNRLVTESDLPQLTFLQAIIKETFRLHPSTPLSLPRIAAEDCEVNGYRVPKGSTLLVNVWAIARDPNAWTDPLKFNPERFLAGGEKPNVDVRGNDFEVIPFGAGRRICAGVNLGLRMVQLLTATLIHSFNMVLPNGLEPENLDMEEGYGLTLQRASPLIVHPRNRLSAHVYSM